MTTTTTTDFGSALNAAIQGGYLAQLNGGTYTITQPIVIHVTSTTVGPVGIDGGGATLVSQVTNGQPLIQIVVDPGVDLRYLTLSNFNIQGNGHEGDGIKIVCDTNDGWVYNWNVSNVTVQHVGGYGLDMQGSVFEGIVSDSWMNNNGLGGAYFAHSANGGQVSALRWFGGGADNNGGAGLMLTNGARDMSVNGATFSGNASYGISAEYGITSVTDSTFVDNHGSGVWFQCYGNFNNDTFSTSGVQTTGINGYLAGNATVTGSTSTYTGSGSDPTTLANLQGNGGAFITGDSGHIVTGSSVAAGGVGGGDLAHVSVSGSGIAPPTLSAVTSATTAPVASSSGTSAVESGLKAGLAGGYVAHLSNANSYTISAPIVINITSSTQGGIDLGGAKIYSNVANGQPVIQINVAAGVDVSKLTLSNFTIMGNGGEGDGIKIVADGTNRSIDNLSINNVNVEHVGGIGLDVIGNVKGTVFDSWMHGNSQGGARFANSTGGGVASGLEWDGGGFRKNGVAGLILDNGAHDMTVKGAYFVENVGPGIDATSGITLVQQSGFENNGSAGAMVQGTSAFIDDTFSTWGPQTAGVAGSLSAGQVVAMTGDNSEYYGQGYDTTMVANLQGNGTLAMAGGGNVTVGPGVTVTGGMATLPSTPPPPPADTTPPTVSAITTSGSGIASGAGDLNAGNMVILTAAFSEAVNVAGGTPTLALNDGGTASYTGGSSSSLLTFSYTVAAGQNTADLAVSSLNLNGATLKDAAGNAATLAGASNYNPVGTLQIDTTAPTVSSIAASGAGITNGSGTVGVGSVVTFTVSMSEAVTVTGTPTLALSDGGSATYSGGSGSSSLTFSHTVAAGQNTSDLSVSSLNLNGGSIVDGAGNTATLSGASGYNPAGTLKVDTTPTPTPTAPVVTQKLANDTGSSSSDKITSSAALSGTADPNAAVRFTVDGTAISGSATASASGAWAFTPSGLADGAHTIVASETNAGGATGSSSLTFTLDTQAPAPAVTGATFANGQVTVTGTSEAASTLWIYDGYSWLGAATAGSDGKWSFTSSADPNASHSYGLIATDLAGNIGKSAASYVPGTSTPTPTPPPSAPTVTEKLVSDTGSSVTDKITASAALSGTADPNAVIHFTVDGASISSTATANSSGAWSFSPSLSDGTHTVVASETNAGGVTGSTSLSFTLDTHAPSPVFTGASIANGQVTIAGSTGSAGDVLEIYDGNSWLGFAATGANGTFSLTATASNTVHSYGANATDLAGNEGHGNGKLIVGSSSADALSGSGGNDVIVGGGGADNLTAGAGKVTFVYNAAPDSTAAASDSITDFTHGADKIDFTNIAGINASGGVPQFQGNITGSGNLTLAAHSVAYIEAGGNTQVLVNTSNAAETVTATDTHAADMKIVLVGVNLGLTGSDFHHS